MKRVGEDIRGVLKRAAAFIRRGWCRRNLAVDAKGRACLPISPKACRWCLEGAVMAASGSAGGAKGRAWSYLSWVAAQKGIVKGSFCLIDWNDKTACQKDVLALLKDALALQKPGAEAKA